MRNKMNGVDWTYFAEFCTGVAGLCILPYPYKFWILPWMAFMVIHYIQHENKK